MKEHEIEDVPLYSDSGLIKSFVKSKQIDCLFTLPLMYIKAILISNFNQRLPNFNNLCNILLFIVFFRHRQTLDQSISNVSCYINLHAYATNGQSQKNKAFIYVKQLAPFEQHRLKGVQHALCKHVSQDFSINKRQPSKLCVLVLKLGLWKGSMFKHSLTNRVL